jgi:hypothetical protein
MEHAEIELLLNREMPHTGHKRLPERAIIGPCGKDFGNYPGRLMPPMQSAITALPRKG